MSWKPFIGLAIIGVGSVWVGLGYNLRYLTLKAIEERIIQVLSEVPADVPLTLSPIVDFTTQIHAKREDVEYVIEVMERKGVIISGKNMCSVLTR